MKYQLRANNIYIYINRGTTSDCSFLVQDISKVSICTEIIFSEFPKKKTEMRVLAPALLSGSPTVTI